MTNKICLCFFGVIPRSIRHTIESIKKNIIYELEKKFIVDIYVFNLNVGNTKVDGCLLDQTDVNLINSTFYEEQEQTQLDEEINGLFQKGICKMSSDYSRETIVNSLRQMYSEYRVGCFLEKNIDKYKGAMICGPDYYILNKIDLNIDYFSKYNMVYTTKVNDEMGITNGIYIGNIQSLVPILKRYNKIAQYLPTDKDYEHVLMMSFIKNNITRNKIDLLFVKIRSSRQISRQGIMRNREYDNIIHSIQI